MAKSPLRILVVDDNRSSADTLARLLRREGDLVEARYDGAAAIQVIERDPPDVVLTDLKMEPVDGMAVLHAARSQRPPIETIVFTAYGAIDVAVRAMHMGARDFVTKPVTLEQVANRLDALRPSSGAEPAAPDADFVAESDVSRRLLATLERASGVPSPVWLQGELGSGRNFCARTLHRLGDERGGRHSSFVVRHAGREAPWPENGTVYLPNVDDLPDDLQRDLFRSLQSLPDGVRLVASARADGRRAIAEGSLRPELYYRLAVVDIAVPALRHRPEDILPLFTRALQRHAQTYKRAPVGVTARMASRLTAHYWPGNIRELLNLAERTAVLGEDGFNLEVVADSGSGMPKFEPGFNLAEYLEQVERKILVDALDKCAGDRNQVSKLLSVERNTLRYKLNKYGLLDR